MSEKETAERLTPKQHKAIEALLAQPDVTAAMAAAGVARSTLYRWLKQPAFRRALQEVEAAAIAELQRSLIRLGDKAIKALEAALDGKAAVSVKVRASNYILGRLLQLHELVDLQEQLNEQAKQIQEMQEQIERGRR